MLGEGLLIAYDVKINPEFKPRFLGCSLEEHHLYSSMATSVSKKPVNSLRWLIKLVRAEPLSGCLSMGVKGVGVRGCWAGWVGVFCSL